jgi:hypothetical protein
MQGFFADILFYLNGPSPHCVEGDLTHELKLVAMKGLIQILQVVFIDSIFS